MLLKILTDPSLLKQLSDKEWDYVIRRARECELLGRVYALVEQQGTYQRLPEFVRRQLDSTMIQLQAQKRAVLYEVKSITQSLNRKGIECVFLKGAAYLIANAENATGRLFSDIDILVPEKKLNETETLLGDDGWITTHANKYDQNYYRRWMHELPPMLNVSRRTVLDVHHNILPRSMHNHPDAKLLIADAVGHDNGYKTLSSVDMLIHAAVHLFHEGEVRQGLRGLVDVDLLFRELIPEQRSENLLMRAQQLKQQRSLLYALYFSARYLKTPLPEVIQSQIDAELSSFSRLMWMKVLYASVFDDEAVKTRRLSSQFYEWIIYVRSHYLRMPPHLLIRHLITKGLSSPDKR